MVLFKLNVKEIPYLSVYYVVANISDNMMSKLILTLTKQVPDYQYTHLYIKTWKVLYRMQVFKGTIFCCVRFCKKNVTLFAIFHIRWAFFSTSHFSFKRDPCVVKIVSQILKSLFHKEIVKFASSDKRQSHTEYTFSNMMTKPHWNNRIFKKSKIDKTKCKNYRKMNKIYVK